MAGIFGDKINSRAEFLIQLSAAAQDTRKLLTQMPNDPVLCSVLKQLDTIAAWAAQDRDPTLAERKAPNMGLMMYREFESTDDIELFRLRNLIGTVNNYFLFWPDDTTASDPDNDSYLFVTSLK